MLKTAIPMHVRDTGAAIRTKSGGAFTHTPPVVRVFGHGYQIASMSANTLACAAA